MENSETAWEYFECDEDVLRILFNIQNAETKKVFIKRWGKNLNGEAASGIKQSEYRKISKAIENFRYDIIYINQLKESKSLEEIKEMISKDGIDMTKHFMIRFKVSEEELMAAIEELDEKKRTIFIYFYGIGRNKLSIEQISKILKIDEIDIINEINKTELCLASNIRMKKQKKIQPIVINSNMSKDNSSRQIFNRPVAYFNVPKVQKNDKKIVIESKNEDIIQEKNDDIEIKNSIKSIDYNKINIIEKLSKKQLCNIDRIVLYYKLKGIDGYQLEYNLVDEYIMNIYNYTLDELINCYIKNLDIFDNPDEIISQILSYDIKYINLIYNSEYVTSIISKKNINEQIEYYDFLKKKITNKQKSK